MRRPLPLQVSFHINARAMQFLSGLPEPTSNYFGFANWSEDEADAKIQAVIDQCREQGIGFQWVVGPLDTPADLGERLERHGMMLAGGYSTMARKGLDADDIPTNPDLVIEAIDREHPERVADAVNVMAVCFHMPAAQAELEQRGWLARFEEPGFFDRARAFVAYLHGQPVGVGRMELSGGRAYLGGAATLPEVRGKKIYSTLLRRRLQDAAGARLSRRCH